MTFVAHHHTGTAVRLCCPPMTDDFKLVPAAASYGSSALARDFNKMQATVHSTLVIDSSARLEIVLRFSPARSADSRWKESHSKLRGCVIA